MSDPINQPNDPHAGQHQSQPEPEARTPIFDSLAAAIRKGAEQARKEAEDALPRLKSAAAEAAYWTAYGVTFVGVFNWTLVKTFTPEVVKKGCRDGMKAGRQAAEDWAGEMRRGQPASPILLPAPAVTPGPDAAQPGNA